MSPARKGAPLLAALLLLPTPDAPAEELPGFADAISKVFEEAAPSVVHISALTAGRTEVPFFYDPWMDRYFQGRPNNVMPRKKGEGSGFVFDAEGLILTNEHVIAGAEKIVVTMADERELDARVVGLDASHDIAVLKLDDPDFSGRLPEKMVARLGDSTGIKVGSWAIAIGSPFGLEKTVSAGIISATGRRLQFDETREYFNLIQTDAAINPGNSGGPLLNLKGEVVGINTAINPAGQGLGFAIPINLARKIGADLVETGRVQRTWLGVDVRDVTAGVARHLGMSRPQGVYLTKVVPGGPAAEAGLAVGDVVLEVRGRPLKDASVLVEQIQETPPGEALPLRVLKQAGQVVDVRPVVRAYGDDGSGATKRSQGPTMLLPELGIRGASLEDVPGRGRFVPEDLDGVLVVQVQPGGRGAALGLRRGDLIQKLGRRDVTDILRLRQSLRAMDPREPMALTVLRGDAWILLAE